MMSGAGILPASGAEATEILGFSALPNGGRDARPTQVFIFFTGSDVRATEVGFVPRRGVSKPHPEEAQSGVAFFPPIPHSQPKG
jgi:hypothetical protein